MGRPAEEDRSNKITIKALKPHHRAMFRYAAAGKKPKEIAEIFGLGVAQVSIIMNSPLWLAELDRLVENLELSMVDAADELRSLTGRAIEVLSEEVHQITPQSKIRARVAFDILDRTGHPKGSDVHVGDKIIHFHSYTPKPGEDPKEAEEKLKKMREEAIETTLADSLLPEGGEDVAPTDGEPGDGGSGED